MKVISIIIYIFIVLMGMPGCNKSAKPPVAEKRLLAMNKSLVTDIYTADPSAHVFEGKLYIYPSHDLKNSIPKDKIGSQFDMKDYHVFSISDFNSPIVDHGEVLHVKDVPWASKQFWAPDAAYKNGTYYLYFPAKDKENIFRIGVATSKKPYGPFKAEKNFIKGSYSMDPAVFVDDDGQAYMFFGGLNGGQLQNWRYGKYSAKDSFPGSNEPAMGPRVAKMADNMLEFNGGVKEIKILDKSGKPVTMNDATKMFFEAVWMHKYKGVYYLSYSAGYSRCLVYATGNSPYGPFTWQGVLWEPVVGWTTHHSIVKYKGKWYLFYHSAISEEKNNLRNIMYTEIHYTDDGLMEAVNNQEY